MPENLRMDETQMPSISNTRDWPDARGKEAKERRLMAAATDESHDDFLDDNNDMFFR